MARYLLLRNRTSWSSKVLYSPYKPELIHTNLHHTSLVLVQNLVEYQLWYQLLLSCLGFRFVVSLSWIHFCHVDVIQLQIAQMEIGLDVSGIFLFVSLIKRWILDEPDCNKAFFHKTYYLYIDSVDSMEYVYLVVVQLTCL